MNFFHRWKISNTLDSSKPSSPSLRQTIANSRDLPRFARETAELDQSLKEQIPISEPPPWLHGSIMSALKAEASPSRAQSLLPALDRLAIAVCVVLSCIGLWLAFNRPAPTPGSFAAATDALDLRNQISQTVPELEVSSLAGELDRLNLDLNNATQTLLAALP